MTTKSKKVSSHVNYSLLTQDSFEGNFGATQHDNVMVQGRVVLLVLLACVGQSRPPVPAQPHLQAIGCNPAFQATPSTLQSEEKDWKKHTRLT